MNLGKVHSDTAKTSAAVNQFLDWINKKYPGSKTRILERAKASKMVALNGLGQSPFAPMQFPGAPIPALPTAQPATDDVPWYQQIADAAKAIVPAYIQYETQKNVTNAQIKRMEQGLPPADPTVYQAPPVVIRHQVDPSTITGAISDDTKNAMMIGAALIGGLILLTTMGRPR